VSWLEKLRKRNQEFIGSLPLIVGSFRGTFLQWWDCDRVCDIQYVSQAIRVNFRTVLSFHPVDDSTHAERPNEPDLGVTFADFWQAIQGHVWFDDWDRGPMDLKEVCTLVEMREVCPTAFHICGRPMFRYPLIAEWIDYICSAE